MRSTCGASGSTSTRSASNRFAPGCAATSGNEPTASASSGIATVSSRGAGSCARSWPATWTSSPAQSRSSTDGRGSLGWPGRAPCGSTSRTPRTMPCSPSRVITRWGSTSRGSDPSSSARRWRAVSSRLPRPRHCGRCPPPRARPSSSPSGRARRLSSRPRGAGSPSRWPTSMSPATSPGQSGCCEPRGIRRRHGAGRCGR